MRIRIDLLDLVLANPLKACDAVVVRCSDINLLWLEVLDEEGRVARNEQRGLT